MRRAACALTALACLAVPAAARGDGLPVVGVDAGGTGVAAGGVRYVTLPAGRGTNVAAVEQPSGRIVRSVWLPRPLGIPAVAYDGSAGGLSADGRTLVLIRPRTSFPQRRTRLLALGAPGLGGARRIDLRGDFSFDAISPDGRTLFLIHYTSRRDPTAYEVRAYDLAARRLVRAPIVDPREPDERMGGIPATRAASADGRWAYTLYDRPGGEPFIHALDTVAGEARCIDLPMLEDRRDVGAMRLRTGRTLSVLAGGRAVARVDLRTWRVARVPVPLFGALLTGLWGAVGAPPPAVA